MSKTPKHPRQLRAYWKLTKYALVAQTRNPATFFFGFIFPVVFICIFGLIGNAPQKVTIGIPNETNHNNPIIATIKQQAFIKTESDEQASLEKRLQQGKIDGIVTVTTGEGSKTYSVSSITSQALPQQASAVQAFVRNLVAQENLVQAGVKTTAITYQNREVEGRQFRYIDFALPGQIGFSLLSTAIFSTVFGFIFLKKALVFKRMFATPTHPMTILLSQGSSRLITALAQTIVILAIGVFGFQFFLPHGIWTFLELLILSTFGLIAFMGFGLFIAGLANDENSASPLTNLVTLPQFLLSGVFFSTENFPTWLQPIANNLPLSYFNQAVRKITTEGGSLPDALPYVLGLSLWSIIMYILAARTFKWE